MLLGASCFYMLYFHTASRTAHCISSRLNLAHAAACKHTKMRKVTLPQYVKTSSQRWHLFRYKKLEHLFE